MTTRRILAVLNDPHSGHRLGLLNPETMLYRPNEAGQVVAYTPDLTASQEYLWGVYQEGLDIVRTLADGAEITLIVNGDATQGNKHQAAWVSTRMADQIVIAKWNLLPFYQMGVRRVRITKGTGAHNFGEGSSEYTLAEMLRDKYPNVDTQMVDHGLLNLGGFTSDYAHHGPSAGSNTWVAGNAARNYLKNLMIQAIENGREPANVYLRAHVHTPIHETVRLGGYTSDIRIVPSLCMIDDHAQQATRSVYSITNGFLVYEIEDGQVRNEYELYKTMDTRTEETVA